MVGIINEVQKDTISFVPHEIMETILSKLPVKSLLRFKTVCKSWESTISDPTFAATHLQQSKNCQNLLVWKPEADTQAYLIKSENNKLQIESAIEHPPQLNLGEWLLCHCDGLILKWHRDRLGNTYMLWNPSSRTYKTFRCPHPIGHSHENIHGICYDPSIRDYKVVIMDRNYCYTVFYCRRNYWTKMKQVKEFPNGSKVMVHRHRHHDGVSINRYFYWLLETKSVRQDAISRYDLEIICFDSREEKFNKLALPDYKTEEARISFSLTCLGGQLCLFRRRFQTRDEISIFRKVVNEDSWMEELKVRLPFSCPAIVPVCLMSENEIIIDTHHFSRPFLLYNHSKRTFHEIQKISIGMYPSPLPYLENLFFTSPT